ncbi:SMODS domain-containing nucleotidyltransferase, partial [Carnobacterium sp.]|uniref:SMODS domain-containing nucleotidyltransferase n=1 Tax=Carnobacterium sp. TaxID=48221 RepID=UPI0028A9EF23
FPKIYTAENDVQMGSFRRRTKIRPIDDIDFIVVFNAEGTTYDASSFDGKFELHVPVTSERLNLLTNDDSTLNSIKLVNQLKKSLNSVPHYEQAEIKRNQEAVTLKLKSYSWNFDIVPAFITAPESDGKSYYLIPDGNGNWKKTDPRIDSDKTTRINKKRDGKALKYVRLIKYWNRRATMPTISSYLLENLILNYFDDYSVSATEQSTLKDVFDYLSTFIYRTCPDPKGIQGDLNDLDLDTKEKISFAASLAKSHAIEAISYSINDNHKMAHAEWRKVFGKDFPDYE